MLADKIGRKKSIIISDILTILGPLICFFFALNIKIVCLARLFLGLGLGVSMMVSQVYLTETSPSALKGQICPGYFLGVFTGFILAHLSSICFAYNLRAMFGIGLIPSLI